MKTFKEFCVEAYQLDEFISPKDIKSTLSRAKSSVTNNPVVKSVTGNPVVKRARGLVGPAFKTLDRIENIVGASGIDKSRPQDLPTRAANLYGIVKPFSLPSMAPDIIRQGQSGSLTDKVAKKIPGMTPNPKTDIGKRIGDKISSSIDKVVRGMKSARSSY